MMDDIEVEATRLGQLTDPLAGTLDEMSGSLDSSVDVGLWSLTDEQLTADAKTICAMHARFDELSARLMRAADERELARRAGATSTTVWLANISGMSRREAGKIVSRGRAFTPLIEQTRQAWASGTITSEKATVIARTMHELPDDLDADQQHKAQEHLLDLADRFGVDDLRRLANHVIEVIDPAGCDERLGQLVATQEQTAYANTELTMQNIGEGMVRGRFTLPTLQAHMLKTVLEGIASPRRHDARIYEIDRDGDQCDAANGRLTHTQRLGRAWCELIEHLPADAMPEHGGLAATVTITIDHQALKDAIGRATLSTGDDLSAGQARRFACNANLVPMVLDGESKVLDIGTSQRLYNRYQRIALARRDRGCCWAGCDRPPGWTEAHHLKHYADGGPTTMDNGALFCFYHHHLLHEGEWDARMGTDGIVEVIPPKRIDPYQQPMRHARFEHVLAA